MYSSGSGILGFAAIFFFVIIIACCCTGDGKTSSNTKAKTSTTAKRTNNVRNTSYRDDSYCECPSCGSADYDEYCEECGYSDVNQGWVGENF
ncbi:MAG: hypothetical protein IJ258_01645 [Methanobrevibacter sp.]|uniref:hypothetical protein n=1 Tax=Methanobrevibacter sp. TaxID=66852 RepID=UPI0025FDAC9C|nr:hypothetical protein [Methanobrevibacter sp.]MBQ8016787.1 hypothetical protein [Methanobrevibacter sp.]